MTTESTTLQIIRTGILELLKHLQHYPTIEVPLEEYFKVHSNTAVDDKMHQVLHQWVGDSISRMQKLDRLDPAAVLEVLHIGAEITLPIGDIKYTLADFLCYARSLGVGDEAALSWVANNEVPWCVAHYLGDKSLICFNDQEVDDFFKTRKQNVQANDPSPDSPA